MASPHLFSPADRSSSSNLSHPGHDTDLNQLVASAFAVLEQSPPPSLREILGAYRSKGDGDRDMLLAMLNAKSAEDQRLASIAALHRSVLELHHDDHCPRTVSTPPPVGLKGGHLYPTPTSTRSPQLYAEKPRRLHDHQQHYPHPGFRSPRLHRHTQLPSMRDVPYSSEPPRKRHCSSHSPASSYAFYDPPPTATSQHEHLPPSPYSSSERSESGDYSPRSRGSMAIGSLLSSRPNQALNGDES